MVELGQLEARHEDFDKRDARVVAVSLDTVEESAKTQEKFPHLVIISDADKSLASAAELIAPQHSPAGGETVAPTTALIDRTGVVRWVSRKGNYLERPTPDEVLAALDRR
ncbi:MAG TPA: redoxin domain-containing protein [Gemmataceae bacterium]|nr:redoxin domain-containing protein [Gemmataceae bacterium]